MAKLDNIACYSIAPTTWGMQAAFPRPAAERFKRGNPPASWCDGQIVYHPHAGSPPLSHPMARRSEGSMQDGGMEFCRALRGVDKLFTTRSLVCCRLASAL